MTDPIPMEPICVIGAGGAGLAALKALRQHNLPVVGYERGSGVGGNWRLDNDNGASAAYASLRCNVSRRRMEFRDFPMPASFGDFPAHADMAAYFDAYAARFDLRSCIRFSTSVEQIDPIETGWRVTLQGGETVQHSAVIVANGHHWSPQWPPLDGEPTVPVTHSQAYRTPGVFADKRVLIVGAGQSAVEIATELAPIAARTVLSIRSGAHVIPRYVFGRPFDLLDVDLVNRLPWRALNRLTDQLVRLAQPGGVARFGLQPPAHRILEQVPVVSSDLYAALRRGALVVAPRIERIAGAVVCLADGTTEEVDAIICATGYRIRLPFIPPHVLRADGIAVPLYRRIVAPEVPGLYFIGLIDAPGGLLPIVETQSAWLADVLRGVLPLPDRDDMWTAIDAEPRTRERFPLEPRHSIRCDPHAYTRLLVRDRRRAYRRRLLRIVSGPPVSRLWRGGSPLHAG